MTDMLRIILIIGIVLYYCVFIKFLKEKKFALKYSLLWLFMGFVMLVLVVFPSTLRLACDLMGIVDNMNGLFTFLTAFILMLLLSMTSIVSKQSEQINCLVQDNALLEKRVRELENVK